LSYANINGTVGTAIGNVNPAVTGTPTSYSISPALPIGLSLNTTTGVISGTPSVAAASANYTVTATNAGGSTTGTVTVVVNLGGSTFTSVGFEEGTENNIAANGLSNLMNYALGQNGPNAPFPAKPVLRTDSSGMILTATARTDDSSLRFYVEWTTDLSGVTDRWDLHTTEVSPPDLTGTIAYGELRKFLRFKVTK
jgi:hypothetical protein